MNKTLSLLICIPLILAGCSNTAQQEKVHIHAGFQIYIDNVLQDYSSPQHMYFSSCGKSDNEIVTLNDKVHLHDEVGDVVHVHSKGMTWNDVLESRSVKIPDGAKVEYFRDNESVPDLLSEEIQDGESVIIFIGDTTEKEQKLQNKVSSERINEIEQSKESCGS